MLSSCAAMESHCEHNGRGPVSPGRRHNWVTGPRSHRVEEHIRHGRTDLHERACNVCVAAGRVRGRLHLGEDELAADACCRPPPSISRTQKQACGAPTRPGGQGGRGTASPSRCDVVLPFWTAEAAPPAMPAAELAALIKLLGSNRSSSMRALSSALPSSLRRGGGAGVGERPYPSVPPLPHRPQAIASCERRAYESELRAARTSCGQEVRAWGRAAAVATAAPSTAKAKRKPIFSCLTRGYRS